jgi:hypothetical protein
MRTASRATIAISVALGALVAATMASASAPAPEVAQPTTSPSGGGSSVPGSPGTPGPTCAIDHPDCNDRGLGGASDRCTGTPEPVSTDPSTPVSSCITDPASGPAPTPQIVSPTPGMANVMPTAFDTAAIGDDDVTLAIRFWSGVEPCAVLDHVLVSYGPDAVAVTLFQGSDPTSGQVACPAIAVLKQTIVTLDEPLAGRDVLDGAS